MKRLIAVVVVLGLLLVGGPWVIGNIAEDRVDRTLDSLVATAPYLGIVERHYRRGWFRSEQDVTFEVLGAGMRVVGAGGATRFSVRNEILHGPVLGFSGLGVARVNTTFVLDAQTRALLARRFGSEQPLRVSTRIGFLGGGKTTFSCEGRELTLDGGSQVSWDDLIVDVRWSSKFDSIGVKGDWPRFEARDPRLKTFLRLEDLVIDVDSERVKGHLYETDVGVSISDLTFASGGDPTTTLKKFRFDVDSADDGDFMSVATRLGSGRLTGGRLQAKGVELTALHTDFTFRRLHTETLARIADSIAESYRQPAAAVMLPDKMLELMRHDPEMLIDRVGFETRDGTAYLKGILRLKGVTEQDLKMGVMSLVSRLDVDLTFDAAQKVIESLEDGHKSMMTAVDGGYAELKGDRVVSHLEFHAGQLKINGKAQGIPGMGPPAPPPAPSPAPE